MIKGTNILLIGLIGFGAYYLYRKNQESLIAEDTSSKGEEQEEATTSDGVRTGGGGVPNLSPVKVDEIKANQTGVVEVKLPKKEEKLTTKPISVSKIGGAKQTSQSLLNRLNKGGKTNPSIPMPTTSMNSGVNTTTLSKKTTLSNPKLGTSKSNTVSLSKVKLGDMPPLQTMSNFYDFNGDELDNEEFIID